MMYGQHDKLILPGARNLSGMLQGRFAKKILVITPEASANPQEQSFLDKVLSAAGIDKEQDTYLLAIPESQTIHIASFLKEKHPSCVLVFGLAPKTLGLAVHAPLYAPFPFYQTTWMFSDELGRLEPDRDLKQRLWSALKLIFS